jgi:hypothetical protein
MRTDTIGRLRPTRGQWARRRQTINATAYEDTRRALYVISSSAPMDAPDGSGPTPTWHISVSRQVVGGDRPNPTDDQMRHVLDTWEIDEYEEDNHSPGLARHLFIPHDPALRGLCECKLNEPQAVTLDGVEWSNAAPDGECAGCQIAAMPNGRPCQIHSLIGTTPEVTP